MENSLSDSDLIESSKSESCILAPDSDGEDALLLNYTKIPSLSKECSDETVINSDEEASSLMSNSTLETISNNKNEKSNLDTSKAACSSIESPEPIILHKRKNKPRILESDEDSADNTTTPIGRLLSYSDEQRSNEKEQISPFQDNICSSTRLVDDDLKTPSCSNSLNKSVNSSNISTNDKLPVIDLTLSNSSTQIKNRYRNVIEDSESDEESNNKRVITIDSESEDDKPETKSDVGIDAKLNDQLNTLRISSGSNTNTQSQNSDYLTRLESLKAEEIRLKMQVSGVSKNIDTIKTTVRTANLSALPDKGVRLQVSLKQEESKQRDLRYQQSTLSNEIIKLQMRSKLLHPLKQPDLKVFKLPTANTDINAMGKRAMETHRTQQALTVDALTALHKSLKNCPNEDTYVDDPKGLLVDLMPHQRHALVWLMWREKEKPSGGILADDMGLGKTLTMISLILKSNENVDEENENEESEDDSDGDTKWLSKKRDALVPGKTLVVCPASLIGQWEKEVRDRVKRGILDVLVHHGPQREKKARRLARQDVVITTYSILPRETASQGPLFGIRWERVILDEAHQIRNYKTQTAQSVFKLKAKYRWALTGTPVQNKEIDLFALLKFLRCRPFDDLAVWKKWVDNRDAAGIQRLNTITKSLMLRRTKETLQKQGQLLALKNKNFQTIFIDLDEDELAVYEKLLNFSKTLFHQFLHQKAERNNALPDLMLISTKNPNYLKGLENPFENHPDLARLHKQMQKVSDIKSHHILVLLLRLRQFCCHPALITTMFEKDEMANDGIEDADGLDLDLMDKLTRMSLNPTASEGEAAGDTEKTEAITLSTQNPLFSKDRLSSKMKKVVKTLMEILTSDDKVVIVSQWISLLELIHNVLKERSIKCVTLNGSVPVKDRAAIVEKFNKKGHGPRVMLLSLTAGGVGLNLMGGNHLLLLDLHWNPQLENQACDRIYRVGQEKNVEIYKFVVSETIEERILKLQESKLSLANDILTGSKNTSKLSLEDLKMLFNI